MIVLNRFVSDLFSTRGLLIAGRLPLCHTLELPWRNNQRELSCIPVGKYRLTKASSPRFAKCFYIHDVPGRSGILIHLANDVSELHGCIAVGLDVNGDHVVQSRLAMDRLYDVLGNEEILEIRSV